MKTKEKSWIQSLFAYAEGEKKKMLLSVQELVPNDVQCFMLIQNIRIMLFVL